jgi:hypothetical protein
MWSLFAQVVPQSFQWHVKQRLFVDLRPTCSAHRWLYKPSASGYDFMQSSHRHSKASVIDEALGSRVDTLMIYSTSNDIFLSASICRLWRTMAVVDPAVVGSKKRNELGLGLGDRRFCLAKTVLSSDSRISPEKYYKLS